MDPFEEARRIQNGKREVMMAMQKRWPFSKKRATEPHGHSDKMPVAVATIEEISEYDSDDDDEALITAAIEDISEYSSDDNMDEEMMTKMEELDRNSCSSVLNGKESDRLKESDKMSIAAAIEDISEYSSDDNIDEEMMAKMEELDRKSCSSVLNGKESDILKGSEPVGTGVLLNGDEMEKELVPVKENDDITMTGGDFSDCDDMDEEMIEKMEEMERDNKEKNVKTRQCSGNGELEKDMSDESDEDLDLNAKAFICVKGNDSGIITQEFILSGDQMKCAQRCLSLCDDEPGKKRHLMITGPPGVGKSAIIDYIRRKFREHSGCDVNQLCICASTGVAASNVGGKTWHSVFGFRPDTIMNGFGVITFLESLRKARGVDGMDAYMNNIKQMKLMIIDEWGMMTRYHIEAMDRVLRKVRKRPSEFLGGLACIFCGDAKQLAPVDIVNDTGFYYDSSLWMKEFGNHVFLSEYGQMENPCDEDVQRFEREKALVQETNYVLIENFRAKKSPVFVKILEVLRFNGDLGPSGREELLSLCNKHVLDKDRNKLHIFPINEKVDKMNERGLEKITKENPEENVYRFTAELSLDTPKAREFMNIPPRDLMDKTCCVGCPIMITHNQSAVSVEDENGEKHVISLVNGSIATITGFHEHSKHGIYPIIECKLPNGNIVKNYRLGPMTNKFKMGSVDLSARIYPFMLAFALGWRKCQGLTLKQFVLHTGRSGWSSGDILTAFSRASDPNEIYVDGRFPKKVIVSASTTRYMKVLHDVLNLPIPPKYDFFVDNDGNLVDVKDRDGYNMNFINSYDTEKNFSMFFDMIGTQN